jgi:hypothetical protein
VDDEPDEELVDELVDDESLELESLDELEPFEESEPLEEPDDEVLDESAVAVDELFEPRLSFL